MSKSTTKQIINKTSIAGATLNDALEWLKANGGGGGGGSPTGPAGGVLSGSYPNPGFAVDMATQAELDAVVSAVGGALAGKQDVLVSGTNIKTVNGNSLLGSGDIAISGGGGGVTDHGALTGLADDDHTQYLNNTRGDARYEPIVAAGASDQYWAGNKTWQNFALAVRSAVLTGLSTATNAAVVATDGVLVAIGKLQAQLNNLKTINGTSILGPGNIVISGGGGGLTTTHVTGATATYAASVGENVSIETTVACVVTAPAGLTAGQKWGVMVCNDRWDNSVNMNGNKHENLSDATMTLKDNKIALEFEMISVSFGQKVKVL